MQIRKHKLVSLPSRGEHVSNFYDGAVVYGVAQRNRSIGKYLGILIENTYGMSI